ncbi:hypothetical protein JCM19298_2969 [Nonlabens ulvanivorans]|nr:hypothetical protein JCM19298_2969 [Nonlabens ulvanivorans]
MFSDKANAIFQKVIDVYHVVNTVDQPFEMHMIVLLMLSSTYYIASVGLIRYNGIMKISSVILT